MLDDNGMCKSMTIRCSHAFDGFACLSKSSLISWPDLACAGVAVAIPRIVAGMVLDGR